MTGLLSPLAAYLLNAWQVRALAAAYGRAEHAYDHHAPLLCANQHAAHLAMHRRPSARLPPAHAMPLQCARRRPIRSPQRKAHLEGHAASQRACLPPVLMHLLCPARASPGQAGRSSRAHRREPVLHCARRRATATSSHATWWQRAPRRRTPRVRPTARAGRRVAEVGKTMPLTGAFHTLGKGKLSPQLRHVEQASP